MQSAAVRLRLMRDEVLCPETVLLHLRAAELSSSSLSFHFSFHSPHSFPPRSLPAFSLWSEMRRKQRQQRQQSDRFQRRRPSNRILPIPRCRFWVKWLISANEGWTWCQCAAAFISWLFSLSSGGAVMEGWRDEREKMSPPHYRCHVVGCTSACRSDILFLHQRWWEPSSSESSVPQRLSFFLYSIPGYSCHCFVCWV